MRLRNEQEISTRRAIPTRAPEPIVVCASCGQTGHMRRSHRDCTFNQGNLSTPVEPDVEQLDTDEQETNVPHLNEQASFSFFQENRYMNCV